MKRLLFVILVLATLGTANATLVTLHWLGGEKLEQTIPTTFDIGATIELGNSTYRIATIKRSKDKDSFTLTKDKKSFGPFDLEQGNLFDLDKKRVVLELTNINNPETKRIRGVVSQCIGELKTLVNEATVDGKKVGDGSLAILHLLGNSAWVDGNYIDVLGLEVDALEYTTVLGAQRRVPQYLELSRPFKPLKEKNVYYVENNLTYYIAGQILEVIPDSSTVLVLGLDNKHYLIEHSKDETGLKKGEKVAFWTRTSGTTLEVPTLTGEPIKAYLSKAIKRYYLK